jgi:hypothetical protein
MRTTLLIILFLTCYKLKAQEYSLGIHLNPAFTVPFTGNSTHEEGIHASTIKPNFNTGLNFNLNHKKISLELAVNFEQKTLYFKQTLLDYTYGGSASYHIQFKNTSFEFPILFGYQLSHRKHSVFYLQAGASAEITKISSATHGSSSDGLADITAYPAYSYSKNSQVVTNVIAGFKFRKTTLKQRVFEYGINYHYPLSNSGHYLLNTLAISSLGKSHAYAGDYRPLLSFIDLKLCYYFISFDNHFKRAKHHANGNEQQLP